MFHHDIDPRYSATHNHTIPPHSQILLLPLLCYSIILSHSATCVHSITPCTFTLFRHLHLFNSATFVHDILLHSHYSVILMLFYHLFYAILLHFPPRYSTTHVLVFAPSAARFARPLYDAMHACVDVIRCQDYIVCIYVFPCMYALRDQLEYHQGMLFQKQNI